MTAEDSTTDSMNGDETPGILLNRVTISLIGKDDLTYVDINTGGRESSPLELLGLLEMAKVDIYDHVIESQYLHLDEPPGDKPGE